MYLLISLQIYIGTNCKTMISRFRCVLIRGRGLKSAFLSPVRIYNNSRISSSSESSTLKDIGITTLDPPSQDVVRKAPRKLRERKAPITLVI